YSGGIEGRGSLWLQDSTVSANQGSLFGGIALAHPTNPQAQTATVRSSTISGNVSIFGYSTSGFASVIPTTISHSTIAFNIGVSDKSYAALNVFGATLQLDSSIIA